MIIKSLNPISHPSYRGTRPSPPTEQAPDLPLYAALYQDHITLYRDMSGDSLHRRGYRAAMHKASLNEAAAAGMLHMAGWPAAAEQEGSSDLGVPWSPAPCGLPHTCLSPTRCQPRPPTRCSPLNLLATVLKRLYSRVWCE